jgi:DNA-binding NtrC family response regulator
VQQLTLAEVEKRIIVGAVEAHDGKLDEAAKALGVSLRVLKSKLREYRYEYRPNTTGESGRQN